MNLFFLLVAAAIQPISSLILVGKLQATFEPRVLGTFFLVVLIQRILISWILGGSINYFVKATSLERIELGFLKQIFVLFVIESAILVFLVHGFATYISSETNIGVPFWTLFVYVCFGSCELFVIGVARRKRAFFLLPSVLVFGHVVLLAFVWLSVELTLLMVFSAMGIRAFFVTLITFVGLVVKHPTSVSARGNRLSKIYFELRVLKVNDLIRSMISNTDKNIIAYSIGISSLAKYGVLQQFSNVGALFFGTTSSILLPRVLDLHKQSDLDLRGLYWLTLFSAAWLMLALLAAPYWAFDYLHPLYAIVDSGDKPLFVILCVAPALLVPYLMLNNLIIFEGHSGFLLRLSVASVLVVVVFSFIFVGAIGLPAIALGLLLGNACQSLGIIWKFNVIFGRQRVCSIPRCVSVLKRLI